MALMNNLLISWNFDLLKSSNESGEFEVLDTSNDYSGVGTGFASSDFSFITKEDIKSYIQTAPENLASHDSIKTYEEDDLKTDKYYIPSSTKIIVENSMYQIVSDEIMNMFSTINNYSFKFMEYSNKYKSTYKKLDQARSEFFSKVLERPSIEKYIEFYKWIDSSLGYMIDQLMPENSKTNYGLKNTIESHVLERNKYKHQLPLTISHGRNFTSGIEVIKKDIFSKSSLSNSGSSTDNDMKYLTASLQNFVGEDTIENIKNVQTLNYKKNYEYFHTAGKQINNRGHKPNKTVIKTSFSTPDKNSHAYKNQTGECSIYNDINKKSWHLRKQFNVSQSLSTPYASTRSVDDITYGIQGYISDNNFIDNNFVQRNVPYTSSNYYTTGGLNYQRIPNAEVRFMHDINLLLDVNSSSYDNSISIIEPPVQFCIPLKQKLQVNTAFENIQIYSPYSAQIDYFSLRNIKYRNFFLINSGYLEDNKYPLSDNITFYRKSIDNSQYLTFYSMEYLNVIYPRTDLIGLAKVRTKTRYEEEEGIPLTASIASTNIDLKFDDPAKIYLWSDNSYNNMPILNRSFWRDDINDSKRTRGIDVEYLLPGTGALNTLAFPNLSQSNYTTNSGTVCLNHERNYYFSFNSMECNVDYVFPELTPRFMLTCSNEIYGELSPYSHFNLAYLNNFIPSEFSEGIKTVPKISFTYNNFFDINTYTRYDAQDPLSYYTGYVLNKSYQVPLECKIKRWYDSYNHFRENIKHKSQDMSIVPEFAVSRHENIIKQQSNAKLYDQKEVNTVKSDGQSYKYNKPISNYLTINGHERFDQIRQEDFKVDLKNFIDKKSNKIKFKLKGVKKLLPYNGFYPQERTVQIAGLFNQEYLNDTGYVKDNDKLNIDYSMGISGSYVTASYNHRSIIRSLCVNQPLFSPGVLFNTIKAGISMPWKTIIHLEANNNDSHLLQSNIFERKETDVNLSNDLWFLRTVNINFPFQTLLNPEKFYIRYDTQTDYGNYLAYPTPLEGVYLNLIYLDPTHHSDSCLYNFLNLEMSQKYCKRVLINNVEEGESLEKMFQAANPVLYKSSINNFLSETAYFFLKNKKQNKKIDFLQSTSGTVSVRSGSHYSMNFVMEARDGFSMFNKYSTEEYNFVPSASLFGPPVYVSDNLTSHTSSEPYFPYCPPYMYKSKDIYRFDYEPTEDKTISIKELLNELTSTYDTIDSTSGSLKNRVSLNDCFYTKLIYSGSWVIQPKFETPIFNFNSCSLVNTSSYMFSYPSLPE